MASLAEKFTALGHAANLLTFLDTYGRTNGTNLVGLVEAAQILFKGQGADQQANALYGILYDYESLWGRARQLFTACIADIARGYGCTSEDTDAQLVHIWKRMDANSHTVRNRAFTRDSFSGWTGTGTGTVYRCTKDAAGQLRESGRGQTVRVECVADSNGPGGISGREKFIIRGALDVEPDLGPLRPGAVSRSSVEAYATRSVDGLLPNASFEDGTGEGSGTTAITGWSVETGTIGTNIQRTAAAAAAADTDGAPYRNAPGKTTGRCLALTAAASKIAQTFSANSIRIPFPDLPVLVLARCRESTGTAFDGTFRFQWGATTAVTKTAAQLSAGWNDVLVASFDSAESYYESFKEGDVHLDVGLSAWVAGTGYVDEILVVQPVLYDGVYYLITAGQTDYLVGDYGDFGDLVSDTGEIQTWVAKLFGRYFPHATGSETYADV